MRCARIHHPFPNRDSCYGLPTFIESLIRFKSMLLGSFLRKLFPKFAELAATLRFQPTRREAWLVALDETRTEGDLCARHAAGLVLPRSIRRMRW